MKKYLLILLLTCLSANAGLKHTVEPRTASILHGVLLLVHMGSNVLSAVFQTQQMGTLGKIKYSDNEVGIAEEDKRCGPLCRENSALIRKNSESALYLDGFATATSALSLMFNFVAFSMWATGQANWEQYADYQPNIDKFTRIALGISATNAFFNIATTGYMVQAIAYHNEEIPITTLSKLQVAVTTGVGYWLPMLIFGGYGLVQIAQTIEAGRIISNKLYDWVPSDNAPVIGVARHQDDA